MSDDWPYKNFTKEEIGCMGHLPDTPEFRNFMRLLQSFREAMGFPFIITSGYRTRAFNASINGAPESAHIYGRAVDISVRGENAYKIVTSARQYGFNGIGVSQKGTSRFIHLDDMHSTPTIWSY